MVNADYLFLMTDVHCLYTNNPRTHPDAQPIEIVEDISTLEVDGIYTFLCSRLQACLLDQC